MDYIRGIEETSVRIWNGQKMILVDKGYQILHSLLKEEGTSLTMTTEGVIKTKDFMYKVMNSPTIFEKDIVSFIYEGEEKKGTVVYSDTKACWVAATKSTTYPLFLCQNIKVIGNKYETATTNEAHVTISIDPPKSLWSYEMAIGGETHTNTGRMTGSVLSPARLKINALASAASALPSGARLIIHTDDKSIAKVFNEGLLKNWQKTNWKQNGTEIKNKDLWERLLKSLKGHRVKIA